jgi:hypothetical protein
VFVVDPVETMNVVELTFGAAADRRGSGSVMPPSPMTGAGVLSPPSARIWAAGSLPVPTGE